MAKTGKKSMEPAVRDTTINLHKKVMKVHPLSLFDSTFSCIRLFIQNLNEVRILILSNLIWFLFRVLLGIDRPVRAKQKRFASPSRD